MSLWHQMWFQSLHNGQALLYRHSWPIFGSLGPFWRPQKGNFMSKLIPFVAPNSHKFYLLAPEKIIRWPKMNMFVSQMSNNAQARWSTKVKCVLDPILVFLGFQRGLICSWNGLFGALRRAPKVQKWVSDAYSENIGQLDNGVVFGTKSGAVQDFQRGKKCQIGVE